MSRTNQATKQPAIPQSIADTSDIVIYAAEGTSVHFTDAFECLGSMLSTDLTSDIDIQTRLMKATQAFGSYASGMV